MRNVYVPRVDRKLPKIHFFIRTAFFRHIVDQQVTLLVLTPPQRCCHRGRYQGWQQLPLHLSNRLPAAAVLLLVTC